MKLVILGSGTSVPHPRRSSPAHWLETDGGYLLLDIGADAAHRMAAEELPWTDLDAIWISHLHLDHVGGLAPFLFGTRWSPEIQDRRKPLSIFGAVGLKRVLEAVDQSNNYKLMEQPFPISLIEVEPNHTFDILPGIETQTFSTPHTPESLAIRLKDKNGSVLVFTSDTGWSDELANFAKGASLLLMECSFHKHKPLDTHLKLSEAMEMARAASPQTVVLTHLYPEWDGIDLAAEARKLWPGETVEAFDGLRRTF